MASRSEESKRVTPTSIEVRHSEQELDLLWADGHRSIYPLYGLRMNCPCVMCRGGHSNMGTFEMELFYVTPPRKLQIKKVEPVGNHAVKFEWDDGHNTGMYRWELLRTLCPIEYRQKRG